MQGFRNNKKIKERFWLVQLQKELGIDIRILEEREEPDFVVEIDGERVGIEVTDLCIHHSKIGSPQMAHESIVQEIVSRAKSFYEDAAAPPVNVSLYFSPLSLQDVNRVKIAKILSNYVQSMNLSPWQSADVNPSHEDAKLPDEVAFLHAIGVPEEVGTFWGVAGAGWAAPITGNALQERINDKSFKLKKYSKTAQRNWLLIVSNGMKPSQMFQLTAELDSSDIKSPFDRTFYLCYPNRIFLEI